MGEIRIVCPGKTRGYPYLVCKKHASSPILPVLQIRRGIRINFEIVFNITPFKHIL